MKKLLVIPLLLALSAPAWAAQQTINTVGGIIPSIGALKGAINTEFVKIDANFDEVYAELLLTSSWVAQATAPADLTLLWIDTDQGNAIKYHNGTVWVVVGELASDTLNSLTCANGDVAVFSGENWLCGSGETLPVPTSAGQLLVSEADGASFAFGATDSLNILRDPIEIVQIGDAAGWVDDGFSVPVLNFDLGDVPDTGGLLGGSGLPEGGTVDQIIVRTVDGYQWINFEDHPGYISLMQAAGVNTFTFAPTLPATYPVYTSSEANETYCFDVTGRNTDYTIAGVRYSIDGGSYAGQSATFTTGNEWCVTYAFAVAGPHTITLEATDSKGTPNVDTSADYDVVLITEPVTVDLTVPLPLQ